MTAARSMTMLVELFDLETGGTGFVMTNHYTGEQPNLTNLVNTITLANGEGSTTRAVTHGRRCSGSGSGGR